MSRHDRRGGFLVAVVRVGTVTVAVVLLAAVGSGLAAAAAIPHDD